MTASAQPRNGSARSAVLEDGPDITRPWMFFRRWIANPLQMGSVAPSSAALCRRIVAQTRRAPDEAVLELGAGTGVVSRALLAARVPADRLVLGEITPRMGPHLRRGVPGAAGSARGAPR